MSKNSVTYDDAVEWTVDDVVDWLHQVGFYEYVEPLQKHNINGKELFELSESRLRRLYPNMPTGKSDPASMLWKQINKVKENRRTGKKPKAPFGWSNDKKQPPKAPEPDYNPKQTNRQNTQDEQDDGGWGSDFSDEVEGDEFDQHMDPTSQQGRTTSYNGSSTSSFTNLSSSASGKDDDSSMLYLAPNTDGEFDQMYEVPSEQMNSSYGDGDCDEIYDVPHDEPEPGNDMLRRPQPSVPGRSVSPQPPLVSPRHEPLRPLPTIPPATPSWQQQQQMEPPPRPAQRQMMMTPHRPPPHYPRQAEIAAKEVEEQENYEVPTIETPSEIDQPNYEAPMMGTQDEEESEQEYLEPDFSSDIHSGGLKSPVHRPPAPLPSAASPGIPPPRPVKPPELTINSPVSIGEAPPPIPTRPVASRIPNENAGIGPPELPPQRDKSPIRNTHHMSNGGGIIGTDENRNFGTWPSLPDSVSKPPPPLPTNNLRDQRGNQERNENSGSNGSTVMNRLKQFQDRQEPVRPQLAPRPQVARPEMPTKPWSANAIKPAPAPSRPSWLKSPPPEQTAPPPVTNKRPPLPPDIDKIASPAIPPLPQPTPLPPQRPTPRPRATPEPPAVQEFKQIPSIPTKEPLKIKKYNPHPSRAQPEVSKPDKPETPAEPEKQSAPARPASKQNDMTGYPWYNADLSRDEAVRILKQTKKDGAFVVRNSGGGDGNIPYSLSLWYNNKVRNLRIRLREDGKYALGSFKENEQVFDSAVLLIQYHLTSPLILAGDAGKTCLKVAAPNFH